MNISQVHDTSRVAPRLQTGKTTTADITAADPSDKVSFSAQQAPVKEVAPTGVRAEGSQLQKLAGDFKFAEGLTCDPQGNVFFTDQPNNRIMKWSTDGELSTFMEPAGRANGMTFDKQGNLLACADENGELWSIAPSGKVTTLASGFQDKTFNGPNDVWSQPSQAAYFTDPFYDRDYWKHHDQPQDSQQVYYLSPDHKTLNRVTDDLVKPNGIVGSPDGKTLYVSDIGANKTYAYDVKGDGGLAGKRLAAELGSDGMTLDEKGNLYLTGNGVTVFSPEGKQIDHIEVPEKWTGNLCFGGKDKKTLFIAASEGLYAIRTQFAGANPAK